MLASSNLAGAVCGRSLRGKVSGFHPEVGISSIPVHFMKEEQIKQTYQEILAYYGPSPYKKNVLPKLVVYNDPGCECYGWCEWDAIGVNVYNCTTPELIVGTLIHEVWHLHQSPTWYTRYFQYYTVEDHPYELECNAVAERDLHLFIGAWSH
jgi:hypothetical protein